MGAIKLTLALWQLILSLLSPKRTLESTAPQTRLGRFFDKPANLPVNRTYSEEVSWRYQRASQATSASASICKLIGLAMVVGSPFALLGGALGIPVAAGLVAGGATTAAIGSSATSNKRAAQMAELNAWLLINSRNR